MLLKAWDTAFVRATRADVHRVLADVGSWPSWWPHLREDSHRSDGAAGDGAVAALIVPPRVRRGRHHVCWHIAKVREPDKGVRLRLDGDLVGSAEWFYLDERAGVTVHHILEATCSARAWRSVLAAHRAAVRHAMERLKDGLEGDRLPGAEPDPALLVAQDTALATYASEIAASRTDPAAQ